MLRTLRERTIRSAQKTAISLTLVSGGMAVFAFLSAAGPRPRWETMALLVLFCLVASTSAVAWSTVARLRKPRALTLASFHRPEDDAPRRA
jgi:O-antigen/teichoic acid export membrane protein